MCLIDYLRRYISITDEEYQIFLSFLTTRKFNAKEKILDIGNRCNHRYYIKKGCVRIYSYNRKGIEQIYHFGIENWWISDYKSLLNKIPSDNIIEAIEPTEVFMLSNSNFDLLCAELPKIERLFRIIMERAYIASQNRLEFFSNLKPAEQYEHFITTNSDFTQRVPQYMLASYLGVTPEFISKIRSKE